MKSFLHLSATDGGRRAVIVDPADEMNIAAANALLKMLEEPPKGVTFLLIGHQPSRLLPTIRSRCRELRLSTLAPDDLAAAMQSAGAETGNGTALAALAGGSVGEAIRLTNLDGLETYTAIVRLFSTLPRLDRPQALKLAESAAQRGAEEKLALLLDLMDLFLARLARAGASGTTGPEAAPGEAPASDPPRAPCAGRPPLGGIATRSRRPRPPRSRRQSRPCRTDPRHGAEDR